MRKKIITGVAIVLGALYLVRSTHGQVQSVPGPGSGIVAVQGEVDVRRLPLIDVGQRGDWKVSLANVADVRVVNAVVAAPLAFLKPEADTTSPGPQGSAKQSESRSLGAAGGCARPTAGASGG